MKTFKYPECREQKEFWSIIQKFFFSIEQDKEQEPIDEATFFFCVEAELGIFLNPHRQSYVFNEAEIILSCVRVKASLFDNAG